MVRLVDKVPICMSFDEVSMWGVHEVLIEVDDNCVPIEQHVLDTNAGKQLF